MRFAGLGHGDRHGGARRSGAAAGPSGADPKQRTGCSKIKSSVQATGWSRLPECLPGGWAFEFRNDFYPDVDDTAFVLMALQRVDYPDVARLEAATRAGCRLAARDAKSRRRLGRFRSQQRPPVPVRRFPFADHNAMIDPSTADVTARVVECLGRYGWPATHPVIERGVDSAAGADGGGPLVRTLGRELRVRHQRRAARARNRCADCPRILPARRGLAAGGAESRRRIRGVHRFLLRSSAEGARRPALRRRRRGG